MVPSAGEDRCRSCRMVPCQPGEIRLRNAGRGHANALFGSYVSNCGWCHLSARSLPGFRPSDAGRVEWPNSLSDRTGSCCCSTKGAGPSKGACHHRARTKRIAPGRSHHEGGRFSDSGVLRVVRHTTSGTNSCGHCNRTQRSGSQRYEHRRIQKRIVNTVIGARRKFNERFCSANAGRHRALGANYQGERVHYRVIVEGNGTFLAAATSPNGTNSDICLCPLFGRYRGESGH